MEEFPWKSFSWLFQANRLLYRLFVSVLLSAFTSHSLTSRWFWGNDHSRGTVLNSIYFLTVQQWTPDRLWILLKHFLGWPAATIASLRPLIMSVCMIQTSQLPKCLLLIRLVISRTSPLISYGSSEGYTGVHSPLCHTHKHKIQRGGLNGFK